MLGINLDNFESQASQNQWHAWTSFRTL